MKNVKIFLGWVPELNSTQVTKGHLEIRGGPREKMRFFKEIDYFRKIIRDFKK